MLAPHPNANLEYWYFKVNNGSFALLVDWIEKRERGEHWLRLSIHSDTRRAVLFRQLDSCMPSGIFLRSDETRGRIDDVSWDLSIDAGSDSIKPDLFPAGLLRMLDLCSISAPCAAFTGYITVGEDTIRLDKAVGMVSHYWGRRLAPEWWWISAQHFDQIDMAVECCVLKSGIWGLPVILPVAYLYLRYQGKSRFFIAPFNMARAKGGTERFTVTVRAIGYGRVMLKCTGYSYGSFGDGIVNTLTGDVEVWIGDTCIGTARGTAGLEHKSPES